MCFFRKFTWLRDSEFWIDRRMLASLNKSFAASHIVHGLFTGTSDKLLSPDTNVRLCWLACRYREQSVKSVY